MWNETDSLIWQRERTTYGVTSERIIIISNFFNRKVKSVNLRSLPEMTLDQKSDGSGTNTFGPLKRCHRQWIARETQSIRIPAFRNAGGAKKVYEIIREAQRRAP